MTPRIRNPFRKKPAAPDVLVIADHPCPACDLADFVKVAPIGGADVVECVNCKTQWFLDRLMQNVYTSGKG